MFKQTALLTFRADLDEAARRDVQRRMAAAARADYHHVGMGLPANYRGGDVVWHLHFIDEQAWRASDAWEALDALARDPGIAELDAVAYAPRRFATREPGLRDGVYRTLFVSVEEAAPAPVRDRFADELAGMPDHIPEILNWGMNATVATRGERSWTHVWEQEFAQVDHLTGPYMTSPYHWGFVDRWFDQEMPCQIVMDGSLRHSVSTLSTSVIGLYAG